MDKLAQAALTWNLDVLKEPRGFIKLLQFLLAIFAFATTTSVSTSSSFSFKCNSTADNRVIPISYPFKLSNVEIKLPLCGDEKKEPAHPCCDYNSSAEFYVFVGVIVFLYCIAAIILYVCFDDKYYRRIPGVRTADFVISCVFVVLWLIASSAWADGLRRMKIYSDPSELFDSRVPDCKELKCDTTQGNFATLNVSIMFGFLNLIVWGGNLWFLYKETHWFSEPELPLPGAHQSPSTPSADAI
ncbi:hypothetical protein NP493_95g02006 [Ridgeia piscesae]|uniref:MARVEL domain-containing protein n=1 Tax=Ridgeia piscesae TaxID=27915 RepID=A0AAD9UHN2_RIDPI|nr:hypothetical protein NP493_95g02006 [Ridgeia piscesae]